MPAILLNSSTPMACQKFSISIVLPIALWAGWTTPAIANGPAGTASGTDTILLEKFTIEGKRDSLKIYENNTDNLFDRVRRQKAVTYRDVILTTYDPNHFDLLGVLLLKKHHRETVGKGHDFLCNYAAINKTIPVIYSLADPLIGYAGGLGFGCSPGAEFLFKRNVIRIENGGNNIKIAHAAGASLCASPSIEGMGKIKQLGREKRDIEFVKEVAFEIRLQDMNRFYAFITGQPLMTSLDALQALVLLGEKPASTLVKAIFARNHLAFSEEEISRVYQSTHQGQTGEFGSEGVDSSGGRYAYFTMARRLVCGLEVMERVTANEAGTNSGVPISTVSMYSEFATALEPGLQTLSGKDYEAYLERILIEAPGHI